MKGLKNTLWIGLFVMLCSTAFGQTTEIIEWDGMVDGLRVFGPFEVEVIQSSDSNRMEITYQNIQRTQFIAAPEEGIFLLKINTTKISDVVLEAKLYLNDVRTLQVLAGGAIFNNEILYGDDLEIKAKSGGSVELQVSLNVLEVKSTQGAVVEIAGDAQLVRAESITGGEIVLNPFEAEENFITAKTGGIVEVKASGKMNLDASTAGEIFYFGEANEVSITTSLGGEVYKKD